MVDSKEQNKLTEMITEEVQVLLNQTFKITVLNMLKGLKENKNKEWKEIIKVMHEYYQ